MKHLITLFTILLFSLTTKAQTIRDTGCVCMPIDIAKKVAQDLVTGDSAKSMLTLVVGELDFTKEKLTYKDSLILTARIKELNLIDQVKNERIQKEAYMSLYEDSKRKYADLSKSYRRYKIKKSIVESLLGTAVAVLTGTIIYIELR